MRRIRDRRPRVRSTSDRAAATTASSINYSSILRQSRRGRGRIIVIVPTLPLIFVATSVLADSSPAASPVPTPQQVDFDHILLPISDPRTASYVRRDVCWDEYRRRGRGPGDDDDDDDDDDDESEEEVCGIEIGNGLVTRRFLVRELNRGEEEDGRVVPGSGKGDDDYDAGGGSTTTAYLFGTIDLSLTTAPLRGGHLKAFRSTSPEASLRLSHSDDGYRHEYAGVVGDLTQGRDEFAGYCNRTSFFDSLRPLPRRNDTVVFRYRGSHTIFDHILLDESEGASPARLPASWRPGRRGASPSLVWPPRGMTLAVDFEPDDSPPPDGSRPVGEGEVGEDGGGREDKGRWRLPSFEGMVVRVYYEIYDGIPTTGKYVRVMARDAEAEEEGRGPIASQRPPRRRRASGTVRVLNVQTELLNVYPPFGPALGGRHVPYDPGTSILASPTGSEREGHVFRPLPWLSAAVTDPHGSECSWADGRRGENRTEEWGAVEPTLRCGYTAEGGPGVFVDLGRRTEGEEGSGGEGSGGGTEAEVAFGTKDGATRADGGRRAASASSRLRRDADAGHSRILDSSSPPAQAFFTSHIVHLTLHDSSSPRRHRLDHHRRTLALAPHVFENPLFLHLTDLSPSGFSLALRQAAKVGFEMIYFSFGSGFDMETTNRTYLSELREMVEEARAAGVEVGGYDLIVLERGKGGYGAYVGDQYSVVNGQYQNGTEQLGMDACLASGWDDALRRSIFRTLNATGITAVALDGPYGGAPCSSTTHAHHRDELDSVYSQNLAQSRLMAELQSRGVYINQPDSYFYSGGSGTGMGYSEDQFSLPRAKDVQVSRMTLADDLTVLGQTAGWMFVPLAEYHAGGRAAEFQPRAEGKEEGSSAVTREMNREYALALAQYLGSGVGASYRGPWLWDPDGPKTKTTTTEARRPSPSAPVGGAAGAAGDDSPSPEPEMKSVLRTWVSFYKRYRGTLTHGYYQSLKRADFQTWDGWVVSNPLGYRSSLDPEAEPQNVVGVAVVMNPSLRRLDGGGGSAAMAPRIQLPAYYLLGGRMSGPPLATALRALINEAHVGDRQVAPTERVLPVRVDWTAAAEPFVEVPAKDLDWGPRTVNTIVLYDDVR